MFSSNIQPLIFKSITFLFFGFLLSTTVLAFEQPTNWVRIEQSASEDKTTEINDAIAKMAREGGGTVYLPAGTFLISSPLKIGATTPSDYPLNVRLLGHRPINSFAVADGTETRLVWTGAAPDQPVIDVAHARGTTIQNLRIIAAAGKRFRYGIFAHRTNPVKFGENVVQDPLQLIAPTALTVLDSGITTGDGQFTVGLRINDAHDHQDLLLQNKTIDANVDHNFIENLYVSGATDDDGGTDGTNGTPAILDDGMNSAGIYLDGSQVQAGNFHNINVENSGTGIFVWDGQLELFGGWFANNTQPPPGADQSTADDNHSSNGDPYGRGGGDIVFRSGYSAGHVIQDVTSVNSFRFLTSFYEDQIEGRENLPDTGEKNDWASNLAVSLAVVGCDIQRTANPKGEVVFLRGNGGPVSFLGCNFGGNHGVAQKIVAAEQSSASVVVAQSQFNHTGNPFTTLIAPKAFQPTLVPKPRFSRLTSKGCAPVCQDLPDYFSNKADKTPQTPLDLKWVKARSYDERPVARGLVVDLSQPVVYENYSYRAKYNLSDKKLRSYDNAPVINAAIAKIKNESPEAGGIVWFPNGLFRIASTIKLENTHGISLMGVGGRGGAVRTGGTTPTKGSILAWDGVTQGDASKMLLINGSDNSIVSGLLLTTMARPEEKGGSQTVKEMIHISETAGESHDIWLENLSVQWHGGYGKGLPLGTLGVASTAVHIGDGISNNGPEKITLRGVAVSHIAQQGVLLDGGAQDVQLQQYVAVSCKRALRSSQAGGSVAWFGGGGGNNLVDNETVTAVYSNPIMIELDNVTGPVQIAGLEMQDVFPTRVLRTSNRILDIPPASQAGRILMYGNNHLLGAPKGDRISIDVAWQSSSETKPLLAILGSGLNFRSVGAAVPFDFLNYQAKIVARNQSRILSLSTLHNVVCAEKPWQALGGALIESLGGRANDLKPGLLWYQRIQNWPYRINVN